MLLVKLNSNGAVLRYPYTLTDLRLSRPDVSFPDFPDADDLAAFGVYPVTDADIPAIDHTQSLEDTVVCVDGKWVRQWKIVPASAEEVLQRTELQSQAVREDRNARLSATDWRFRSDMTPSQEWKDYCQSLRDVPNQAGFPFNVIWPTPPA